MDAPDTSVDCHLPSTQRQNTTHVVGGSDNTTNSNSFQKDTTRKLHFDKGLKTSNSSGVFIHNIHNDNEENVSSQCENEININTTHIRSTSVLNVVKRYEARCVSPVRGKPKIIHPKPKRPFNNTIQCDVAKKTTSCSQENKSPIEKEKKSCDFNNGSLSCVNVESELGLKTINDDEKYIKSPCVINVKNDDLVKSDETSNVTVCNTPKDETDFTVQPCDVRKIDDPFLLTGKDTELSREIDGDYNSKPIDPVNTCNDVDELYNQDTTLCEHNDTSTASLNSLSTRSTQLLSSIKCCPSSLLWLILDEDNQDGVPKPTKEKITEENKPEKNFNKGQKKRRGSRGLASAFTFGGDGRQAAPTIPEEVEQDIPIIQRIYLRAARHLHSNDARKVEHARLMLHRLKQAGFEPRQKSHSHPTSGMYGGNSGGVPSPTITVTLTELADSNAPFTPPSDEEKTFLKQFFSESQDTKNKDLTTRSPATLFEGKASKIARRKSTGSRLCGSRSDPNLYNKSNMPINVLLGAMETTPVARRKDSVVSYRKRSSVPNGRRGSFYGFQQQPPRDVRRHSFLALSNRNQTPTATQLDQQAQCFATDETDTMAWSVLMSSLPPAERRTSQIRRQNLILSIPVCVVGKENPVTFTTMEAIERTLRRLHPEVLVKKKLTTDEEVKSALSGDSRKDSPNTGTPSDGRKRDRKVAVVTPPNSRHVSISACISSMKGGPEDYDLQMDGIKTIGAFAEEESLKVLFAKSEAISCIVSAMKLFPDKEELQLNACTSLAKMASASESNCVHIIRNGGLRAVRGTLRQHIDNPDIVQKLLTTLAYISTAVDLAKSLVEGGLHSEILSIMSRHAADGDVVRESCYIIGNLLVNEDTAYQLMLVGGVHTIISLVKSFPEDEAILENACRTLGSFAIYDDMCLDVAKAGATSAVIDTLRSDRDSVEVQECGLWALASLTAQAATCQEVVILGGVPVILTVLKNNPQEEHLQDYGIRIICNLSSSEGTTRSVNSEHVLELLHQVLVNFPESVELLEITMMTLSQVMLGDEELYAAFINSQCIKAVTSTMMSYTDNTFIQESGCKIFGNLAVHDNLRKSAEEHGASKAVIAAMLSLETCAEIQEVGCIALMNLTADNEDNKVRIKNAGAVTALLNTIREFQYNSDIVLCALKALGNLVSLDEVCHLLLDERGLEAVVSLVDCYVNDEEILVFVALVLCSITELPDLESEHATLIDARLMSILAAVQHDADITLYVCQAFENLVKSGVGRDLFVSNNRMEVILKAMEDYPENSHIHRCCCKVVAVVSLCIDRMKGLMSETTIESVLTSMRLFPLDSELQIIGCGTLACLVEKTGILKHELICQGGINIINRAVQNHGTDSRLAVVAVMALDHVVPIDTTNFPTDSVLARETILTCMKTFSENKEIQICGCRALGKIDITDEEDVIEIAKSVIEAIRRHGREPEVQSSAAAVLKPYYRKGLISSLPQSPSLIYWTRP